MFSFRRESTRAFRWLTLSLLTVGVIASSAFAAPADHLIISEVLVKTEAPVATNGSPFIEIVNPTGTPIPMDHVYLTNGASAPATYYYNIALLNPATDNPGGGTDGAFHARFPTGFTLPAGGSIAIALNGSTEYQAAYGRVPDFELFEDGAAPDAIPEMLEAWQGSINAGLGGGGNVPALADAADSLILYSWNGTTNLVQDLDYLIWGSDESVRIDKSGFPIGGESYLADTVVASQEPAAAVGPAINNALRRISTDEGTEITTGGNGYLDDGIGGGHDETSENLATTFPVAAGHEPPAANQPFAAAPIFTAGNFDPAAPYAGQEVTLSITVMDQDEVEEVVFYYSIDGGAAQAMGGTQTGAQDWSATMAGQSEGMVVAWWCVATNTSTVSATYPAGSPNFASTWTVAADPGGGDGPAKLLLTEISTAGTEEEYVEIYNPGNEVVDLSDYYLTDANYTQNNQHYFRIGEGNPSGTTIGGGDFNDFHARFPDGFSIAPGGIIVMTVAGSTAFFDAFGFDPDLELFEDGAAPDAVPDMRWVFGNETSNSIVGATVPTLSNAAETVILYHFVTGEDKITDIDVFTWQDPSNTSSNIFFNKTGVTIGSHSYLPEAGTSNARAYGTEVDFGTSYQRIDPDEGAQVSSGSNGVQGRDETSEDIPNTFTLAIYDPGNFEPGGGVVEPDKLLITEVCTKDAGAEFIEIHNPGTGVVDLSNYYLTDAVYAPGSQFYWQIAEGNPSGATVGGGASSDFHAKFPDGYSLAAGDTIVIAVNGSTAFNTAYGFLPDLKLFETDEDDDDQPTMEYIFGDDTNNSVISRNGTGPGQPSNPGLADDAETVVLYNWQPGEDKVVDIDVFFWTDPTSTETSFLFDKSGVTVGSHTYLPDTDTTAQTPFSSETDPGFSYHRTDGNEGTQKPSGSNGVDGRDETSENFDGTFQMAAADPVRPAPPPVGGDAVKLLLTEVATLGSSQEFIEIYNPSGQDVDLSDYYLTDANHSPNDQYYYNIGLGNPSQSSVGGGAFSDFHARFPAGYTIAAGDTIVVSVPGSEAFESNFGFSPHLELYEDGDFQDQVPDMRWIFGDVSSNSIYGESDPTLTNGAETVILYHFVTGEDKVTDIDVFTWKDPEESTTTSIFFNKTGRTIGSHSYLPENGTNESDAFGTMNQFEYSYHRTDPTEGDQTPTGSNGVAGRDETSENCNSTFAMLPYDPARSEGGGGPGETPPDLPIDLYVEAKTFIPNVDGGFPIRFISRPQDHSETRVRIFDLEGRVILTVFDSRFDGDPPRDLTDPNQARFTWDGRDATFELVKGGMYVVHLSVVGIREGNEEVITAPVVVGTRLSK